MTFVMHHLGHDLPHPSTLRADVSVAAQDVIVEEVWFVPFHRITGCATGRAAATSGTCHFFSAVRNLAYALAVTGP